MNSTTLSNSGLNSSSSLGHESSIICFGDIHGHLLAAEAAISLAEELNVRAVFLGDYIDRGPDSIGVLRAMIKASRRHPDWVFLLGNHDWMLKEILEGRRHPEGFDERTFTETLPCLPPEEHTTVLEWLQAQPAFMRCGAFLFIHGGFLDAAIPIEDVPAEELVWTYGIPEAWQGETVVRGHTLVDQIEILPLDININTRCGFGGHLTGLLLDASQGRYERSWQISEGGQTIESTDTLAPLP